MADGRRESQDFVGMPEEVYDDLLKRSRQVSPDTAQSIDQHRKLVRQERAERRQSESGISADV